MSFSKVFLAGAGFMGSGITYLLATKTNSIIKVYDADPASLDKCKNFVRQEGAKAVKRHLLDDDQLGAILDRIKYTGELNEAALCELVIEAIAESLAEKKELFSKLDRICEPSAIFASNTSSLSITSIASATQRQQQFIGMHFFSPAYVMKLIELIPGADTSSDTVRTVQCYAESIGKTVIVAQDMPGFVTTRLGMVLINEAVFALMEGISSAREIDLGMTLGYNHPMGPLALADFIGLDICLHSLETLYDGFGDPKYRACPLLRRMVNAGNLGKKTGRGFYEYSAA